MPGSIDDTGNEQSWRAVLLPYNREPYGNPLGLLPGISTVREPGLCRARRQTRCREYVHFLPRLALIRSDITFSPDVRGTDTYKRRRKRE
jgi:hypothetical protein